MTPLANLRRPSIRRLWFVSVLAVSSIGSAAAAEKGASPGSYFDAKTVADAFAKVGGGTFFNQAIGQNSLLVRAGHRTETGKSELHAQKTDVLYVVDGSATFVTGGTLVGAKETAPDEMLGSGIDGGEAHVVKKGDIIIIPKGTPHWFKDVSGSIEYFTVQFK